MNNRLLLLLTATALLCATVALPTSVLAVAPPQPQPNGDLILSDDFTDASKSAWQSFGDKWMRWEVGDGIGRLSSSSADDELSAQYLEPVVADVYLEVDLRIPTSETEGAGVTVRSSNLREAEGTNWHYYHVGIRPATRVVELGLLTEGNQDVEQLDSCRLPPSLSNFTNFRRLRVEVVGEQFNVFIDGKYVCAFTDATLSAPGLIGLYVGVPEDLSSKGESVAEFRQLRAYAPLAATASATATPVVAAPESKTFEAESAAAETGGVFYDDFSNSKGGWRLGRTDDGEVRIEDGVLLVRNYTASPYRTRTSPGITATDVIIDVDTWLADGTDDNWQGFFCRADGEESYYSAAISADGYYAATAKVNGEVVREQEPTRTDAIKQGKDAVNRVNFICLGSSISFMVNGTQLIDWYDESLTAGEFGVGVSAMDGDFSEVAFDNFIAVYDTAEQSTASSQADAAGDATAVVTASTLNVRSGPGSGYTKISTVKEGDQLPVLEANADCTWVKVVTPTTVGWISASYATLTGICEQAASQPTTAAPQPTARPTADRTPSATQPAPASPLITDFESFGVWRRGDETWGEFRQSSTQAFSGRYAGELSYDFPANIPGDRNYVVFMRSIPIAGEPTALEMQVYGDGSGSFLNVWVKDAGGQVWQFTFGQINHTGWQRMVAPLDTTLDWPVQPISGSGGDLEFPLALHALVLDYPTSDAASGVVYFDDLKAVYE